MVYSYNEKSKKLKSIAIPKLRGSEAVQVENTKAPKSFLKNVMSIKLNIVKD